MSGNETPKIMNNSFRHRIRGSLCLGNRGEDKIFNDLQEENHKSRQNNQ